MWQRGRAGGGRPLSWHGGGLGAGGPHGPWGDWRPRGYPPRVLPPTPWGWHPWGCPPRVPLHGAVSPQRRVMGEALLTPWEGVVPSGGGVSPVMGTLTPPYGSAGAGWCHGGWGAVTVSPCGWGCLCRAPLTALSPARSQSEEDKQLQDELEMLVERLGVSLRHGPPARRGGVQSWEPWPGLGSIPPAVTAVPCAVAGVHWERSPSLCIPQPCCRSEPCPWDLCLPLLGDGDMAGGKLRGGVVVVQEPASCFLTGSFPLQEKDTSLYRPALEELRRQIRSSTTSMTSVPKPLKFLRPHYGKLKEIYENMAPGENKVKALGPAVPSHGAGAGDHGALWTLWSHISLCGLPLWTITCQGRAFAACDAMWVQGWCRVLAAPCPTCI